MAPNPNDIRLEAAATLPVQMCVEATRWCNLKCEHCRRTVWGLDGREPMSAAVLERLAETFPKMDHIAVTGWGESLYGPSAWELLKLGRRSGIAMSVTSNASLLGESQARRLIEERAGFVSISMDAGTSEGYRRLRPGGVELEHVAANVRGLTALRERQGSPFPFVGANFVLHEDSAGELGPLARLLARIGVRNLCIQPRFLTDFPAEGLEGLLSPRAIAEYDAGMQATREAGVAVQLLLPEVTQLELGRLPERGRALYFLPTRRQIREENLAATCKTAWDSPFLGMDGNLYPCNFYPEPLGNIVKEGSFEKAFDNDAFREFRRGLQGGDPAAPCMRCRYTLWYKKEPDRPVEATLLAADARLEGLGFYGLESPANEPPFRWTRSICDFYLAAGAERRLWIEARAIERNGDVEIEIDGRPCGAMRFGKRWSIRSLAIPEGTGETMRVTLRCRNAVRDPATPQAWQRRRLLGIGFRGAGMGAVPAGWRGWRLAGAY